MSQPPIHNHSITPLEKDTSGVDPSLTKSSKSADLGSGINEMYERDRADKLNQKLRIRRDGNSVVINGILRLSIVIADNIMILEDDFKSSYDCKVCQGAGRIRVQCLKCEGSGKVLVHNPDKTSIVDVDCGKCDSVGYKDKECEACKGKGALIEIPKDQRKKPTSGTIVSVGPDVKTYRVGDRVCYTSFTGHFLPFNNNDRIKVMREHEAMCLLEDVDPSQPALDQVEFASSDDPYKDMPY